MFYQSSPDRIVFVGPPVDLIKQYYQMFGDKQCCFADLQLFINLLQPNQVAKVGLFIVYALSILSLIRVPLFPIWVYGTPMIL